MQIWWGFRFGMDVLVFYVILRNVVAYPRYLYRYGRSENVRWSQRRRPYVNNPYFNSEDERKLTYDKNFRPTSPVIL